MQPAEGLVIIHHQDARGKRRSGVGGIPLVSGAAHKFRSVSIQSMPSQISNHCSRDMLQTICSNLFVIYPTKISQETLTGVGRIGSSRTEHNSFGYESKTVNRAVRSISFVGNLAPRPLARLSPATFGLQTLFDSAASRVCPTFACRHAPL